MKEISARQAELLYKKIERVDKLIRQIYDWGDVNPNVKWTLPNGSDVFGLIAQAYGATQEIIEQSTI